MVGQLASMRAASVTSILLKMFVSIFDASVDEKDVYGQEKKNSTEEQIQDLM